MTSILAIYEDTKTPSNKYEVGFCVNGYLLTNTLNLLPIMCDGQYSTITIFWTN